MAKERDACKFFFEAGNLKRVARSGWWLAGVKNPESVAEHSWRTSIIAFVLAELEGLGVEEGERAAMLCLFHDLPEARCNDLHKVGATYVKHFKGALSAAAIAQAERMPKRSAKSFLECYSEFEGGKTRAAIIAKDADLLECAFQAKEYLEQGFSGAGEWIVHAKQRVKTRSAKKLLAALEKTKACSWFEGLKAF